MPVYVDNFRVPKRVGNISGRWSHLTADSPQELVTFARKIGLKEEWVQAKCKYGSCPTLFGFCAHFHFDVTDSKREQALAAGARSVTWAQMGAISSARRHVFRQGVTR